MEEVRAVLDSLILPVADWQVMGAFDYQREYDAGVPPNIAAMKANRQWWHDWNKSPNQECQRSKDCWLPRGHQGQGQSMAEGLV